MRRLPLTILFWGLTLIVFGQSSAAPTKDFFYGTWTDSTKEGITLTKEKKLILIKDTSKKQGLDSVKPKEFAWTYNLSLEKKPLTIEFNCEECDGTSMPKKIFGQIELINSGQIYLIIMDPSGKAKDRLLLTKN